MGKIIENYSLQSELGQGVYSRVFKAINLKTKQEVAIKMVRADRFKELPKLEEGTINEINTLTNLYHCPHIIRYYDMLKTVNNFYFVYEYCNGGTLESFIRKSHFLAEKVAISFYAEIIEAFKVLSKHNVMHRDLKPENILLHDGMLKLADFGFCKLLESQNDTAATMLGTPVYMAPQILKGETYSMKADIWSLGVVLFKMLFGFCPFESNNIAKLIMLINQDDLVIPNTPQISANTINLLKRMIVKDPTYRADWSEVFSYSIIDNEIVPPQDMRLSAKWDSAKTPSNDTTDKSNIASTAYSTKEIRKVDEPRNDSEDRPRKDLIYNPKETQHRNAYASKSPIRDSGMQRRQVLAKTHAKCLQLLAFASCLAPFDSAESLQLIFYFVKHVERDLLVLQESTRKQTERKIVQEEFLRTLFQLTDQGLKDCGRCLSVLADFLRREGREPQLFEMVHYRRKSVLKKFVNSLKLEQLDELTLISRLIDYIEDGLMIRKESYEKMSREHLARNIHQKLANMTEQQ